MDVPLLLMADYANMADRAKLNVMGIFSEIFASAFPVTHPEMYLVFTITATPPEYNREPLLTVTLMDADDRNELFHWEGPINVPQGTPGRRLEIPTIMRINGVQFPAAGEYQFSVLIDNDEKNSARLLVSFMPELPAGGT